MLKSILISKSFAFKLSLFFISFLSTLLVYIMHPRLYMHSLQYATYDQANDRITFKTRHANGHHSHFVLSRNQFLALNDAMILIEKEKCDGNFPLGQYTWLHYNAFDASLYKETENCARIEFTFASFEEYKSCTHRRLLSLLRLNDLATVEKKRRIDGRSRGRGKSTSYKRPSSVVLRAENQSSAAKRPRRGERTISSRTSNNGDMPNTDEESAIFPEWHHSTSRGRFDSPSPLSSPSKGLSSPEIVRLKPPSSTSSMETE